MSMCRLNAGLDSCGQSLPHDQVSIKEALYRIWCGVNRLGDIGVNRLGDTSAFVNTAGQLLLTRRGKTRMDGIGIVFEFYTCSPSLNELVYRYIMERYEHASYRLFGLAIFYTRKTPKSPRNQIVSASVYLTEAATGH